MPDAPFHPADSRPWRRFRFRWGCILTLFALPIAVLMLATLTVRIAWTIRESMGKTAMERRLAQMEAEGVPFDNDSLAAEYVSQTSSANSDRWVALLDRLESPEFREQTSGVFYFDPKLDEATFVADGDWPHDAPVRDFIAAYGKEIGEVVELSSYREPVTFPILFESLNTLLPYTQGMRTASRLIWLDGLLAIRDRDSQRIRRAVESLLGNAEVCAREPFIISRLTCVSQILMAVDLAKLAIENQRLELVDLNLLLPQFSEASKLDDSWRSAIRGERAAHILTFRFPVLAMDDTAKKPIPPRGRDCLIYLDLMTKAEQIETPDIDSLRNAGKRMAVETNNVLRNGSWLTRLDSIMTGAMTPAFDAFADALVNKLMRCRLAAIGTKIEICRLTNGRLPANLTELDLPLSEFMPPGGEPFGYRINADGNAVLWGFSLINGPPGSASPTCTPKNPPPAEGLPHIIEDNAKVTWNFNK